MRDAIGFGRQWAGLVALLRLEAEYAPGARLLEVGHMVGTVMPIAPASSVTNSALSVDPTRPPTDLATLAEAFRQGGVQKWGLWVAGDDRQAAEAATEQGMVLDSHPAPMIADLDELPFEKAHAQSQPDLGTVGRVNDLAYGYTQPKLAPAIAALPDEVRRYGDEHSVAVAYDIGDDTAVWYVGTVPQAQRQGRSARILRRLLLDARERGQRTSSLQASPAGKPLYERLGFKTVGTLHLYEQQLAR